MPVSTPTPGKYTNRWPRVFLGAMDTLRPIQRERLCLFYFFNEKKQNHLFLLYTLGQYFSSPRHQLFKQKYYFLGAMASGGIMP